jgi:short-subunit dehydrogenase
MIQVNTMSQESFVNDSQKPWALVTGASAGIGAEFCRQLAAQGYQLVLVARRADKLQTVADELRESHDANSRIISADLSKPDACQLIVKRLEEENIHIEYLVNNAGYGLPGSFHVPDWQEHADFIQVMMTAVCDLTWRLLPGMHKRGKGFIVNVASVAGLVPSSAGHTLYGASKSFLIKFSESLAQENEATGVKVTALCPGFTYSEFHDVNNTREVVNQLPSYLWLDAKTVVSDTLAAMSEDNVKPQVIPGRLYKAIVWVNRYLPWLGNIFMKRKASNYRVTD